MNIMEGVELHKKGNGILIKSENPLYILSNRRDYDFKYATEFDNHYFNTIGLKRIIIKRNGIIVISSVEFLQNRYFTNISLLLDANLDNLTMLNLFKIVTETICSTSNDMNAINNGKLDNKIGNFYNTIFIVCKSKSEVNLSFDISLFYEVKEIVDEALKKSFKYCNICKYV